MAPDFFDGGDGREAADAFFQKRKPSFWQFPQARWKHVHPRISGLRELDHQQESGQKGVENPMETAGRASARLIGRVNVIDSSLGRCLREFP